MNLIGWDIVCKPKSKGGLCIRKISNLNKDLFTKMDYNLAKDEASWCKILKAKYLGNSKYIY